MSGEVMFVVSMIAMVVVCPILFGVLDRRYSPPKLDMKRMKWADLHPRDRFWFTLRFASIMGFCLLVIHFSR